MKGWQELLVALHAVVVVYSRLAKLLCIACGGEYNAPLPSREHVTRLK